MGRLKWRIRKRHFLSKIKGSVPGRNSVQSVVVKVGNNGGNQVVAEDPRKVLQDPRKTSGGLSARFLGIGSRIFSGGIEIPIDNIEAWRQIAQVVLWCSNTFKTRQLTPHLPCSITNPSLLPPSPPLSAAGQLAG